MKPNANLYRLNTILEFTSSQKKLLEQIGYFNPEPQINKALALFSDYKDVSLTRLITWHAVDTKGEVHRPLYDLQTSPYRQSLEVLTKQLNETNFKNYLRHPDIKLENLVNFKITEIKWFLFLTQVKNPLAPPFAPKRLKDGLKFVLTQDHLKASFQHVSQTLWHEVDYNPTTVIPLTHENFQRIILQQAEIAKTYFEKKEKK